MSVSLLVGPGWMIGRWARLALVAVAAALLALALASLPAAGPKPSRHARVLQSRLRGLSMSEQAVISSRLGAADSSYRARATSGGYRLTGGGVAAELSQAGATLHSGTTSLSLSPVALGHGARLTALSGPVVSAHGNQVELARGDVREAYASGPLGLEQTFTLARRPAGAAGPLTLALDLHPLRAHWLSPGRVLSLGGVFRYGGLSVIDARGVHLRARLDLHRSRVLIRAADAGAVYPLRIDPFVQVAKLTASDGAAQDDFGTSVAVSGTTVAVGASNASVASQHRGAVYVFTQPGGGWGDETQAAKLTASDGASGDALGESVATDGSTVVAGETGAVYVFTKPSGGWADETEAAKLTELNPGAHDSLGASVALAGSTVVAGDPGATVGTNDNQGAVYVFDNDGAGWSGPQHESAILTASDGAAGEHLGRSVAMSGGTVVAGSAAKVGSNSGQGAAYVFTKPAGGWSGQQTEAAKLTGSDGAQFDFLGNSVAIDGGTVIANAGNHAYVFTQPAGGWSGPQTEAEKLTNSNGGFIGAVGVSGSTAIAGGGGALYMYNEPAGGWAGSHGEDQKLTASDNADNGTLGGSVAIDGTTVVAGAYLATVNHSDGTRANAGAAYIFQTTSAPHTLSVTRSGSGSGSVSSSPAGIDCGATCSARFDQGSTVTLTAKADPGSVFTGWSGGGCSGTGTCTITMGTADQAVSATFVVLRGLQVVANGSGAGSVSSGSGGINCGLTCSGQFADQTAVTLTVSPASGSTFAGWSGGGCSGTQLTCTVSMDADKTVTATFSGAVAPHLYWTDGPGGHIGRSNLDGSSPVRSFIATGRELFAVAVDDQHVYWASGGLFDGTTPGAIGRANLDGSDPQPDFIKLGAGDVPEGLAVDGQHIYWTTQGTGPNHTLTSASIGRSDLNGNAEPTFITNDVIAPVGLAVDGQYIYWINFDAIARANLVDGSGVKTDFIPSTATDGVPVAVAVDGQHLYWSEDDTAAAVGAIGRADISGNNPTRPFITDAGFGEQALALDGQHLYWTNLNGSAIGRANLSDGGSSNKNFLPTNQFTWGLAVSHWQLSTTKTGSGDGTITSDSGTIDCGASCTGLEPAGRQVTLTAKAAPGSVFTGWSGGGCSGTGTCTITTGTADQAVTAAFSETLGATTGSVRNVTSTGAQVFGLVNPHGTDASTWFEYGPDTNYDSRTATDDAGTQNGYVAQADLSGLQPGKTYHYRVVAQQGSGPKAFGADRTFTTLGPRVSGISVGSIGQHGATVSVTVDPAGHDANVHLDYGTDTSYSSPSPGDATVPASGGVKTVQIPLSGLQPGTTYHFRLVIGNSDAAVTSDDNSFTTTACQQCAKPSISGIQAQSAPAAGQDFDGTGTISAVVDPHNVDTTVHVDYGPSTSYGTSTSDASVSGAGGPQTVQIQVSNLAPNTTYHFRVDARNAKGTTNSSDQTFTACSSCAAPKISNVGVVQTIPDTVPAAASTTHTGSAVISAIVDPQGLSTQVQLVEGEYDARTQKTSVTHFSGVGKQTVSGGPTIVQFSPQNLTSGHYFFQIVATNQDGADQTPDPTASNALFFDIGAPHTCISSCGAPPHFNALSLFSVDDHSAILSATIDPNQKDTSVYITYWPANAISNRLTTTKQKIDGCVPPTQGHNCSPTPPTALQLPVPGQIGGGLVGLQPSTTYKAQVVAISTLGTTTSPTITFTTSAAALPQTVTATATAASSTMTCATKQTCSGTAVIALPAGGFALDAGAARAGAHGKLIVLGSVPFRIRGHHRAVIKVPLNARGRRAVRQHRTLKAILMITFRPPRKKPYTVRHPVKLVRRR